MDKHRAVAADFPLLALTLILLALASTQLVAAYGTVTDTFDAVLVGEVGLLGSVVTVAVPLLALAVASVVVAMLRRARRRRGGEGPSMRVAVVVAACGGAVGTVDALLAGDGSAPYRALACAAAMVAFVPTGWWLLRARVPEGIIVTAAVLWWLWIAAVVLLVAGLMLALSSW